MGARRRLCLVIDRGNPAVLPIEREVVAERVGGISAEIGNAISKGIARQPLAQPLGISYGANQTLIVVTA